MSVSGVNCRGITVKAMFATLAFTAFTAFASTDIASLLAEGDAYDAKLDTARALESYLQAEQLGSNDAGTLISHRAPVRAAR